MQPAHSHLAHRMHPCHFFPTLAPSPLSLLGLALRLTSCPPCTAYLVLLYVLPVPQLVEKLYRQAWTRLDGLGALVLTPTRELAMQIFEELVKVRGLDV